MSLKSWGEQYNPSFGYAKDYCCQNGNCDWDFCRELGNLVTDPEGAAHPCQNIVGFSKDLPTRSLKEGIVGIVIFECQRCFSKFWFHATNDFVPMAVKNCDRWPKMFNTD